MKKRKTTTPKIQLGDRVVHTPSGFTGMVVARTEWLNGCWRMTVQPRVKKSGELPEPSGFDEFELEVVEVNTKKVGNKETGGPRPEVNRYTY